MDQQLGQWRVIGDDPGTAATPAPTSAPDGAAPKGNATWQLAVALAALVIAAVGVAIWVTLPQPTVSLAGQNVAVLQPADSPGGPMSTGIAAAQADLVVDVEGAVAHPGVATLPSGSRVGDAIRAAGGYSTQVDIAAATTQLNLAELLKDGQQIHVPTRAEAAIQASPASDAGQSTSGLIDINRATSEQLDTLPGVGPVTAAKIISAREDAPFATTDEMVSRGVMSQSTYDKLSSLVTAAP